jgi:hypothetical protein
VATAFSDHHAVILRLPIETQLPLRGRSYWKMNITYLNENNWIEEFQTHWTHWQEHKRHYPNNAWWWCRYVKTMLKIHFMNTGTNRRRDRQKLENFYYAAIYDKLKEENIQDQTYIKLRKLKAKIIKLYIEPQQNQYVDTEDNDLIAGEEPSLYQLLRQRKRQKSRLIEQINDDEGNTQTTQMGMLRFFATFMEEKYATKMTDVSAIHEIVQTIKARIAPEAHAELE